MNESGMHFDDDLRLCGVTTDGQSLAAQEVALTAAGCAKVYAERFLAW